MPERRPYPGDGDDNRDTKRPKLGQDFLAVARAKAAAKAAEIAKRNGPAPSTNGVSKAAPPPPSHSPSPAPATDGNDRLAAIRARMAALKSGNASPAPPVKSVASPSDRDGVVRNESKGSRFATTLGNRRTESPMPERQGEQQKAQAPENPYWNPEDAEITSKRARVSRGLLFNQRGKFLDQASKLRQLSRLEQIKAQIAKQAKLRGLDENSERNFLVPPPPDVEWWDEGLLEEKTYECIDDPEKVKVDGDDSIITIFVQHPVSIRAPQDSRLTIIKPMHLTAKEQAKKRRMRRAEEMKEVQAKIRLGLEPPPPPKVKRGNMMRVMGEAAIADPTRVEALVEAQIKDREEKHAKDNEERALTKEQKHEKLAENQKKDAQKALYMCVFKIPSLAYGKHRYQIDNNAKQHSLTGITIFNKSMNMVVVEGGSFSIAKYKRLMLNRIKWTDYAPPTEAQEEKQANDPDWMKSTDRQSINNCILVFEGEIKERAFRKWGSRVCETDGEAREILGKRKLDSLWALAQNTE